MFKSSENLRLAAEMRALERVARPWREVRVSWFDGTPQSIEARLASTERVLTFARAGMTPAHMALEREAAHARAELREASHRLMVDFLDDGARAFKGSKRVAGKHDADPDEPWKNQATGEDTTTEHWDKNLPPWDENYEGKHREGAKERGLRECINCEGALSGEEGDDKDAECHTCGMSAHEKGVDYRKSSSRHTAGDGMSYDDTMSHIDEVLAGGEGHGLHNHPGSDKHDPEFGDGEPMWAYDGNCPECNSDNIEESENYSGRYNCYDCGGSDMTPTEGLYRVGHHTEMNGH